MRAAAFLSIVALAITAPGTGSGLVHSLSGLRPLSNEEVVRQEMQARLQGDLDALTRFRPGYGFWRYVYSIPDGSIAFGSATDGRLLGSVPTGGDWTRAARWEEDGLDGVLEGVSFARRVDDRRDQVALALQPAVGPVVHNATRGNFLLPNARRYGGFLEEWGAIYERFGVPAEVGLAQAVVESGLAGKVKSEAKAIGFCQWLPRNWQRLNRLAGATIEAENQTTQAPYCAAYLSVLATKYNSFIPALSEHHAGGVNVGRTVINGGLMGGADVRERYFLGSDLAVALREMAPGAFRKITGSYGPRSHLYAEMVFGNTETVKRLRDDTPQDKIYGIRTSRAFTIDDIRQRTGLTVEQLKRFNPALVRRVPAGANLYLPVQGGQFGEDVSFWHRPAPAEFETVLSDFLSLNATVEEWDEPEFDVVLRDFRRRFRETGVEEGRVMDVVIGYVMQELPTARRILGAYRTSPEVHELVRQGAMRRALFMTVAGTAQD